MAKRTNTAHVHRTAGTSTGVSSPFILPEKYVNTLSVVLSVVCILTDIMQRSSISISSVEYSFGEPISKLSRTGVVLWETPYWQDGRLVASRPFQIPQPVAPTTRRRRGFECLYIDGVPHLSSAFSGISDFECRVGGILGREARCDSGAACFNKNRIDCVPNLKCQLGAFEPCIVDRTCALLPASWKGLKLVDLTAFSCLDHNPAYPLSCLHLQQSCRYREATLPNPLRKGHHKFRKGVLLCKSRERPLEIAAMFTRVSKQTEGFIDLQIRHRLPLQVS